VSAASPALRLLRGLVLLAVMAASAPAQAGHELPFYPSYYPQEIRLETLELSAAAAPLRSGALHAYVGGDPFAGGRLPANVSAVESLRAFVVVTVNPAAPAARSREGRCEIAARAMRGLAAAPGFVAHPYPVTPYHPDYLEHFDLIQARRAEALAARDPGGPVRLRARGATARRLVGARAIPDGQAWDAMIEEVEPASASAPGATVWNGWLGPPWLKQGWYHASLVHSPSIAAPAARGATEALVQRLTTAAPADPAEAAELGRRLVGELTAGCERAVAGYLVRREPFSNEFSQGIENVARDSQAGLDSHIFLRTAKLKDFPWNGWLRVAIPTRPQSAWNPLGGFTDPAGRLLWAAVGDPALLPSPASANWLGNRVTLPASAVETGASIPVPDDALAPEPGTGLFREVGKGKTARARVTYRVWTSAFHDNTRMTPADVVYPYSVAARWSEKAGRSGEHDAAIEAGTALARQSLVGFRVVRVETEVRKYSDVAFTYVVPLVEVYLASALTDPSTLAALAPPWSPVPWHLAALMEEAVRRGAAAFSADEARRRGVPWLDLARDARVRAALGGIAGELAAQGHVPPALRRFVNADEAQARWASLRAFAQKRGHYLITSGPYQLDKWSDGATVLSVFRDFSYPLGVGSYDRHAIPRRAYVTKVAVVPGGLELNADVERVEKFLRDWRLVREPLAPLPASGDRPEIPTCRYVVIGAGGEVAAAGTSTDAPGGKIVVRLAGRLKPGAYTVVLALALGDNWVNPEVAIAKYRVDPSP
jgi:hypothetical protein